MRRVRQRATGPELEVRKALRRIGYRYRLNLKSLPGSPDIVVPRLHLAIFVHGCFWHRHEGCRRTTTPKARSDFWNAKFAANVERDRLKADALEKRGWKVVTIWECESGQAGILISRLEPFVIAASGAYNQPKVGAGDHVSG